jgi:hypothetical protein
VPAPSEEQSDDSKDSYEELEQIFISFISNMKIPSGDFNAKVGRQCIFKLTFGNEILH